MAIEGLYRFASLTLMTTLNAPTPRSAPLSPALAGELRAISEELRGRGVVDVKFGPPSLRPSGLTAEVLGQGVRDMLRLYLDGRGRAVASISDVR